jgi:SPP1 Gp6-like portal protein
VNSFGAKGEIFMPSAVMYVPPTNAERGELNGSLNAETLKRQNDYKIAIKYYLGDQDKPPEEEENDITYVNMVKMTCERTSSFLFPSMPSFQTDPKSIEPTPEEAFIAKTFQVNGGLPMLDKMTKRGFLAGHNFVYVKPKAARLKGSSKLFPRINLLDPLSVNVYWRADDVADVLWYEQRYFVGNTAYIKDYVNMGETWRVYTYAAVNDSEANVILRNIPTPHGNPSIQGFSTMPLFGNNWQVSPTFENHNTSVPPIIEWAHLPHPNDYFGLTEFGGLKTLQDSINSIASERMRIVRQHADPLDFVTGAEVGEVIDDDGVTVIPNPNARVQRLEFKGDMVAINTVLDKLVETYLSISRVVLLKGEAKDLQRVTNASVRTLFIDALAKNSVLQGSYGAALSDISKLVLLMGFENHDIKDNPVELDVTVKFAQSLPQDMTEIVNMNTVAIRDGYMSERTAATNLNLDFAFEKAAGAGAKQEAEFNIKMAEAEKRLAEPAQQPIQNKGE